MKLTVLLITAILASSAFANTRNCTSREVDGYVDEREYMPAEDGSPAMTFLQGTKARILYIRLPGAEEMEGPNSFKKSSDTAQCSKEVMTEFNCATYTCLVEGRY